MRENRDRVEDREGMCEVLRNYFTELFTREVEEGTLVQEQDVRNVLWEQNSKLTEDFSFSEFATAVKKVHPDKSAGPDGLNLVFFQRFWSTIGKKIYEYCKSWLLFVELLGELNCTNVVLIPKKKDDA